MKQLLICFRFVVAVIVGLPLIIVGAALFGSVAAAAVTCLIVLFAAALVVVICGLVLELVSGLVLVLGLLLCGATASRIRGAFASIDHK